MFEILILFFTRFRAVDSGDEILISDSKQGERVVGGWGLAEATDEVVNLKITWSPSCTRTSLSTYPTAHNNHICRSHCLSSSPSEHNQIWLRTISKIDIHIVRKAAASVKYRQTILDMVYVATYHPRNIEQEGDMHLQKVRRHMGPRPKNCSSKISHSAGNEYYISV